MKYTEAIRSYLNSIPQFNPIMTFTPLEDHSISPKQTILVFNRSAQVYPQIPDDISFAEEKIINCMSKYEGKVNTRQSLDYMMGSIRGDIEGVYRDINGRKNTKFLQALSNVKRTEALLEDMLLILKHSSSLEDKVKTALIVKLVEKHGG